MIFIGIDIAKYKHCACVNNPITGELLVEPFFFKNNKDGFSDLLSSIKPYKDSLIGLEDTGHYGNNLIDFLRANDFKVALINPRLTKMYRNALGWTAKNDKKDSILITKVLMDKDNYRLLSDKDLIMSELKEITRRYHDGQEDINRFKNRLQKAIDIVFPEYNKLFGSPYGIVYNRLLESFGSADNIANTDIRTLRKAFRIEGKGRRISLTAEALKESAKNSIGINSEATVLEIKRLLDTIKVLESYSSQYQDKIKELSLKLNSPIISIPGISHITGMTILAEIGDIHNFDHARNLVSFAGVAPYVVQSGEFTAPKTSITKKGSSYLRKALYQCSLTVITNNPVFHNYYTLKISEGKSHFGAKSHVVRKLIRIIYHLLTDNIEFNEKQLI